MPVETPFTLTFGVAPFSMIDRSSILQPVFDDFLQVHPSNQVYMISGLRGSGKTILLSETARYFSDQSDWIVCNLTPEKPLMEQLNHCLPSKAKWISFLRSSNFQLSVPGFSFQTSQSPTADDAFHSVQKKLALLAQQKKSVLITIDEVTSSQNIREFVSEFQLLLREGYRIFLVMAGLFDNIRCLQDSPALTFLYRTPVLMTTPLNIEAMAALYKSVFHLADQDALKMASSTKGYPFAFQALGYQTFRLQKSWKECLPALDETLRDLVYKLRKAHGFSRGMRNLTTQYT